MLASMEISLIYIDYRLSRLGMFKPYKNIRLGVAPDAIVVKAAEQPVAVVVPPRTCDKAI
jgi:hypothetical protein